MILPEKKQKQKQSECPKNKQDPRNCYLYSCIELVPIHWGTVVRASPKQKTLLLFSSSSGSVLIKWLPREDHNYMISYSPFLSLGCQRGACSPRPWTPSRTPRYRRQPRPARPWSGQRRGGIVAVPRCHRPGCAGRLRATTRTANSSRVLLWSKKTNTGNNKHVVSCWQLRILVFFILWCVKIENKFKPPV